MVATVSDNSQHSLQARLDSNS